MTSFSPVSELKIGHVVEVSGTTARVELSGDVAELNRTHAGRVYDIGQIGSVVKIHFGRRLIFGFVTLLRMRSEELAETGKPIPPDADQRVMEVDLFAEGVWSSAGKTLSFQRGISTYPLPRQGVYILTREETGLLYAAAESKVEEGQSNPLVGFARYVGSDAAVCRANIDRMFSTHCAVLGSTGSGKSGAVAALLHSVLEHQPRSDTPFHPRITIIDPHGEYSHAFGASCTTYRAYDSLGGGQDPGQRVKLPYWLMSADEFRHLLIGKTEFEATSQNNIVYKALTHARLVAAGLASPTFGAHNEDVPGDELALDESRPAQGIDPVELIQFDRDKPRPFSLAEFANHIEFAQGSRPVAGKNQKLSETDFAKNGFKSVLDKLRVLRRDPRIAFLMEEHSAESPSLAHVISQFVGDSDDASTSLRIIDISGLPNEVAGPLTAMLARLLFLYKLYQTADERKVDPLLLVCEEAHRYVPDRGEAEYAVAQSAIRRIAREGRKYGLGLMLVSQRPSDIESTVIAQCGTWLVLRLTNSADQQHVARFLPDGLSGMVRALPSLGQQEALFVGEGAALPARIRIRDLERAQLPQSASVPFAEGWETPRRTPEQLAPVVARMVT